MTQPIKGLYDSLIDAIGNKSDPEDTITSVFGKGTEFEAVARSICDEDSMWQSFLVFKDVRFSPSEEVDGLPAGLLQLKHFPPGAANGVLAHTRAENHWKTLCDIFTSLMPKKIATLSPEHMALDIDDVLMLREYGVPERDIEGLNRYVETIIDERNQFMLSSSGKPLNVLVPNLPKYEE